jgi:hypothetical protein
MREDGAANFGYACPPHPMPEWRVSVDDKTNPHADEPASDGSNRRNIVGLVIVIVVAGLGWLLIRELQAKSKLEDCLLSGRRDCAPIETRN